MNIFYTNKNPEICAKDLDDKRLVKMVLETAQLLSTAISVSGGKGFYTVTHTNHPCAVWVRKSRANYAWTFTLFCALADEYFFRYKRKHKCLDHYHSMRQGITDIIEGDFTEPPKCVDPDLKLFDVVSAYRAQMIRKWKSDRSPKWTDRKQPIWRNDYE